MLIDLVMLEVEATTSALQALALLVVALIDCLAITMGVSNCLVLTPWNEGVSPRMRRIARSWSLNRAQGEGFPVTCLLQRRFLVRAESKNCHFSRRYFNML